MLISDWSSDVCSSDLGARLDLFGIGIPLPSFSHPIGDGADSGFLAPDIRYDRTNGIEIAVPYNFQFAPNRAATVTPHLFSDTMPMLPAEYREINRLGAFRDRKSTRRHSIHQCESRM